MVQHAVRNAAQVLYLDNFSVEVDERFRIRSWWMVADMGHHAISTSAAEKDTSIDQLQFNSSEPGMERGTSRSNLSEYLKLLRKIPPAAQL